MTQYHAYSSFSIKNIEFGTIFVRFKLTKLNKFPSFLHFEFPICNLHLFGLGRRPGSAHFVWHAQPSAEPFKLGDNIKNILSWVWTAEPYWVLKSDIEWGQVFFKKTKQLFFQVLISFQSISEL